MLFNPTRLDGIFLDFFGTVAAGDREAVEAVCLRLTRDLGLELTAPELAVRWGDRFFETIEAQNGRDFKNLFACECESLSATIDGLGRSVEPEDYVEQLRRYWRCPPLHHDVHMFFASFSCPICIVSNVDHDDLWVALNAHGLQRRVVDAVSSELAEAYKPEPAIFELALRRTGWRRDRVLHVGDSLHSDVAGARRCGLASAWIRRSDRIYDVEYGTPDYVFKDLCGIVNLFTR